MRAKNPTPSYLLHRQSGRARALWTDPNGKRREQLLPGTFNSEESKRAFARIVAEHAVSPVAVAKPTNGVTVNELLAAYDEYAKTYYVKPDGTPASEYANIRCSLRPLRELYGDTDAAAFGPLALRAVRQKMIEADICRSEINRRMERIRRLFKWAVAEELIPPTNLDALRALPGLRRGRTEAREAKPVKPVDLDIVRATLPYLPPHARALIEILTHTGARPSEACNLRLADIDRSGEVWLFKLEHHKTAHHGRERIIPLGPQARAVILDHLRGRSLDPTDYLFSPARQREERYAAMREARKTKVQPSQKNRRKPKAERLPSEKYTPMAIAHAVRKAVKAANAKRIADTIKAGGNADDAALLPHWHPYQLRHAHATKVRKAFGLEAAQTSLGHARANITEVYTERDTALAITVAAKVG